MQFPASQGQLVHLQAAVVVNLNLAWCRGCSTFNLSGIKRQAYIVVRPVNFQLGVVACTTLKNYLAGKQGFGHLFRVATKELQVNSASNAARTHLHSAGVAHSAASDNQVKTGRQRQLA